MARPVSKDYSPLPKPLFSLTTHCKIFPPLGHCYSGANYGQFRGLSAPDLDINVERSLSPPFVNQLTWTMSGKLVLYHIPGWRSTRAAWLLEELKNVYQDQAPRVEIKYMDPNEFRKNKSEDFLRMNPNGKLPLLVDEEEKVTLWDGTAICYYLLGKNYSNFQAISHTFSLQTSMTRMAFWLPKATCVFEPSSTNCPFTARTPWTT